MDKSDYKMGKTKTKQGYATFRAKYVSDSMTIANSVGVQINRTPYRNLSGNTSIMLEDREVPDEFTFESHRDERYYSFEWNGDYFLRLKNNFDLTSELSASYMKTSQDYDYSTLGQSILNDIEEDAWNFKVNATLRKRLRAVSFGLNLISSYNGNIIHYLGTTPSNVKVTDWYVMPRLVFNLSTGKFRVNGNVGVSYEEATYNGLREVYVNGEANDNTDAAALMRIFTESEVYDDEKFPATSERKRIFKTTEKGVGEMCEVIERNRAEGRAEGKAEGRAEGRAENLEKVILNCLKQNYALDAIASITDSTVKKIKAIAKKHKIEIDE